jgi:hypothetical protein
MSQRCMRYGTFQLILRQNNAIEQMIEASKVEAITEAE